MKTIRIVFAVFSLLALISCGPSQKEIDRQEKENDSIMNQEREKALNNADKLLQRQDSIDAVADTTVKKK
jgi:hypothetical protein